MEKKPKLNVTLLRHILRHLREEPRRYNQGNWGKKIDPSYPDAPACGTQGCIAGWAVFLSVPQELWPALFEGGALAASGQYMRDLAISPSTPVAQRLLGLTDQEAYGLFAALNQTHTWGTEGVREAGRKINLLIRDRAKFVERYGRC